MSAQWSGCVNVLAAARPPSVNYGIDPDRLVVWIECFDPQLPDRPGVLCRRHADAMVVPVRWTLDDRREAVPRLFRVGAPVGRRPRRSAGDGRPTPSPVGAEQLALDPPSTAIVVRRTVDPDGTGSPWRPVFDPDDDLDGLLDATGPLLARAFARPASCAAR